MQGKKKYIALILFLLIGLMVFTFANPAQNEEKEDKTAKQGEVVKEDGGDEITTINGGDLNDVQNGVAFNNTNNDIRRNAQNMLANNVEQAIDNSYANALEMVEKAEKSLLKGDYNNAQDLVNNLADSNAKNELSSRLDKVINAINVSELVANLEKKVSDAANLDDMNGARSYNTENDIKNAVNNLDNENLKNELTNRLNDLDGLLSDEDSPVVTGINDGDVVNTLANVSVEDANEVKITLNGQEYVLGTELEEDGEYVLVITDAAFNETVINFTYDTTPAKRVYSTLDSSKTPVESNKTKYYYMKNGDSIIFRMQFSEKLSVNPTVTIGNASFEIVLKETIAEKQGIYVYEGAFAISENEIELTEGLLDIRLSNVIDLAGNESTDEAVLNQTKTSNSRSIIYDRTAPKLYPTDKSIGTNGVYSKIDLKLNDNIGLTKAIVNGKEYERIGKWNDLNFQNVNNYVEGENTVVLVDLAGNETEFKFTYDKTAPSAVITFSNNNGNVMTNQDVIVTLIASEAINTPTGWTKLDDITFTKVYEKNAKDSVVITDKAGNTAEIKYEVKRIDKVAPEGTITTSNGNGSKPTNQDVTVTLTTNESILTPEGWTRVKDKVYTKIYSENAKDKVVITDKAGNTAEIKYEVKRIDKVAPKLTVVSPNKYYIEAGTNYVDKGYSAYDAVDKDVTKMVKVSYLFQAKGSNNWVSVDTMDTTKLGVYKLTYTAYDKAGNTSKGTRVVAIQDTTNPKFIGLQNGHRYNKAVINVEDVTLDSIKVFYYSNGETKEVSNNTTLTEVGTYKITAYDKAGNSTMIYVAVE